ncbi:MAG: hypothetical protein ACTTJL_06740 [Hoylesella enoeca]|uniref:hypothetical protein n=1 Tax=Hoylesella enoeca TaxID=76123 RepID=UPI003F9F20B9
MPCDIGGIGGGKQGNGFGEHQKGVAMLNEVLDSLDGGELYLAVNIRELFLDGQEGFSEGTLCVL